MPVRDYQTNLMLENLLYVVRPDAEVFGNLIDSLRSPPAKVVEADCQTTLGLAVDRRVMTRQAPRDDLLPFYAYVFHAVGGQPVTAAEAAAFTTPLVHIRHPAYCASLGGGICRRCALAGLRLTQTSFLSETGSHDWRLSNESLSAHLPAIEAAIGDALVLAMRQGHVSPYLRASEYALLTWFSSTYSGGMLGLQAIERPLLPLKSRQMAAAIGATTRSRMETWVVEAPLIPTEYADFFTRIEDNLEAAVLATLLYGMFGGKTYNEPPPVETPPAFAFSEM